MTISIVIQSSTTVTVTRVPGWIGRWLFGHQESTREARLVGIWQWAYADNDTFVEPAVEDAIDKELDRRSRPARTDGTVRR
jgi:hypothetical protein